MAEKGKREKKRNQGMEPIAEMIRDTLTGIGKFRPGGAARDLIKRATGAMDQANEVAKRRKK